MVNPPYPTATSSASAASCTRRRDSATRGSTSDFATLMSRYATSMSQNDPAISFRSLVHDVGAAVDFYVLLGCEVRMHPGPGFAQLAFDGVAINLNQVGGEGGASQRVAGETPVPGGWNRIQLRVDDLDSRLESLAAVGVEPVDGVVDGRGGRQALVRDPSGNLIELFQPHPG